MISESILAKHGYIFSLTQYDLPRLAEFEENLDERADPSEIEALRMEANTWGLLQALMP